MHTVLPENPSLDPTTHDSKHLQGSSRVSRHPLLATVCTCTSKVSCFKEAAPDCVSQSDTHVGLQRELVKAGRTEKQPNFNDDSPSINRT